jgi:hypothetical protein
MVYQVLSSAFRTALRWTAASFEAASKGFRRIMGYKDLWMLKAALEDKSATSGLPVSRQPDSLESHARAAATSNYRRDIIRWERS